MAESRKVRVSATARIRRRRSLRRRWQLPDASDTLAALLQAWTTTVVASVLLVSALALSQLWDGAVFRHAMRDALTSDPQLAQPIDNFSSADFTDRANLPAK
jgi:hypothetical protein